MLKRAEKNHPSKPEVDAFPRGCEAGRLAGQVLIAEIKANANVAGSGLFANRAIEAAGRHVGRFGTGYRVGLAAALEEAISLGWKG